MRDVDTRRAGRRAKLWIASGAVCALVAAGGIVVAGAFTAPVATADQQVPGATAKIQRGDLSGIKTVPGTLDFSGTRDLPAGVSGILTQLPDAGGRIGVGGELYRVDNAPVYLFRGAVPAWRSFAQGMADGPDVQQLEQSLKDLGFFDAEPDEHFTWHTAQAIKAWQKATGQEQTGAIELGRIVFAPTDLRVGEVKAAIGDSVGAGTALYRISDFAQQIHADVKLPDQKLAQLGTPVAVHLPGGVTTTGKVVSVGQVVERDAAGGSTQVIPITVVLDDPAAADGLQRASVTVDLPSESRKDVLSVPLDALLALPGSSGSSGSPGGGFGVEIVQKDGTTRQVPVTVGMFAGGRVEVSGDGLAEGLDVLVPKR